MNDLQRFVTNYAVASKLSGNAMAASYNDRQFVFIHGYPMMKKTFYMIATKAIFGSEVRIAARYWEELHAETRLLCQGLNVELQKGREAFSVLRGIRAAMNWSSETFDKEQILDWVGQVEKQLNTMGAD